MIFVKVETHFRDRKPKPVYLRADSWPDLMSDLSRRMTVIDYSSLHTVKLHAISESEYNRHTHPQFNI